MSVNLTTAMEGFYQDRAVSRITEATATYYHKYLDESIVFFLERGVTTVEQITAARIRELILDAQSRGLSPWSVHHYAAVVKAFLNFCVSDEIITVSPMVRLKMPRLPKEIQPAFSKEDVAALLAACQHKRDTAIVLCLLDTGCRAMEFVNLKVGDVNVVSGLVQIKRGKCQKDRIVFLGSKARRALKEYLRERDNVKPGDPLWAPIGGFTDPFGHWGLSALLRRLGQRAGVQECHPHTFRRTFALSCLRAGMDIFSLQRLMGHEDLTMLRRYLAQLPEDLAAAHARAGAVEYLLAK